MHKYVPWAKGSIGGRVVNSIQTVIVNRYTIDSGRAIAAAAAPHSVSPAF